LTAFISNHINYPKLSEQLGDQGIVYVQFIVTKTGEVKNAKVRKGVTELLDKEAMRVVSSMPNWIPGEQNGEKINVRFTLPIQFRISDPLNENKKK